MADTKTFHVRSTLPVGEDGGNSIALWERDPAHPNGEVWIAGPDAVEVGDTAAVQQAITDGKLEKVTAADAKKDAR